MVPPHPPLSTLSEAVSQEVVSTANRIKLRIGGARDAVRYAHHILRTEAPRKTQAALA